MPAPRHPLDVAFKRDIDDQYTDTLRAYRDKAQRVLDTVNDLTVEMYRWMASDPWPENTEAFIKLHQAEQLIFEVLRIIEREMKDPDPFSEEKTKRRSLE